MGKARKKPLNHREIDAKLVELALGDLHHIGPLNAKFRKRDSDWFGTRVDIQLVHPEDHYGVTTKGPYTHHHRSWSEQNEHGIWVKKSAKAKSRLFKVRDFSRQHGRKYIVGWKKVRQAWREGMKPEHVSCFLPDALVKLHIPVGAPMRQGRDYKCRAQRAKVISFHALDGSEITDHLKKSFYSSHDTTAKYCKGVTIWSQRQLWMGKDGKLRPIGCRIHASDKLVHFRHFDRGREECAAGIHFFLLQDEAANYQL